MTTIGICGQGFVGTAVNEGMKHHCEILTYDKYRNDLSTTKSIFDLCRGADIIFVCVPTPMIRTTGECDTSIVEEVVDEIAAGYKAIKQSNGRPSIVIKSTVPPGTTQRLQEQHKHVYVIHQPEFLTEKNSVQDFRCQDRIVIGGESPLARAATKRLYEHAYPKAPVFESSSVVTEMVKYMTNVALMTRVVLANEIYQICAALDIQYERVAEIATADKRLGGSHWQVPCGGIFGAGGHCFPKDLNALMFAAKKLGIEPMVMKAVWEKNLEVRSEKDRDWEQMIGRAVVES